MACEVEDTRRTRHGLLHFFFLSNLYISEVAPKTKSDEVPRTSAQKMWRKYTSARQLQEWRRKKKGEVDDEGRVSGGVPQCEYQEGC